MLILISVTAPNDFFDSYLNYQTCTGSIDESVELFSTTQSPFGSDGTSFVPFFHELADAADADRPDVCVYLTDGHGDFPKSPPGIPTLWVVTVPGLDVQNFPFGQVAPLLF